MEPLPIEPHIHQLTSTTHNTFSNAAPTPIASRTVSYESKEQESTTINKTIPQVSIDDDNNIDTDEPIGGILAKYKKSGLLFRKSYTGGSPRQSPILEVQSAEFPDSNVINLNDMTNESFNNDLDKFNLSVQAPPRSRSARNLNTNNLTPSYSPRASTDDHRRASTHEWTYKPRHRTTRSNEMNQRTPSPRGRHRACSDGTALHNNPNQNGVIGSFSDVSFAIDDNNAHHEYVNSNISDIIDEPIPSDINIDSFINEKKEKHSKYVHTLDYMAIFVSGSITWIFYNLYIAFYNWNQEIDEFNDGTPSKTWHNKYVSLVIIYLVFIWCNMGFNPFYFSYFRSLSQTLSRHSFRSSEIVDINTKRGTIKICIMRFWIISFLFYCLVMTGLCIVSYNDYSVRLAQLTVLYVLMPGLITNTIISGYLLCRQPGIFIAVHCISWLVSVVVVFFAYRGYDGYSLHIVYYCLVSIISFCAYILAAVAIKASISIHSSDLERPKSIELRAQRKLQAHSMSRESTTTDLQLNKNKFKDKPIDCCCNRCELELVTFFKIESLISALTFWTFWGVVSIANEAQYDTITELVFVIACCWWNPMFYSTTNRASTSHKKCIYRCYFIFGAFCGMIQCVIFAVYWYVKVRYGSDIGANGDNGLHLGDGVVLHEVNVRFGSFMLTFMVSFVFYFPATGYLFYRSPLAFGLSHLLFAMIAVFVPLAITDIAKRNLFQIGETEFGVAFITDEFDRDISNKKMTVIVLYMVIFSIFLSFSGFSCTYFRFKKVLVESQAIVTGYKSFEYRLEYPMTLTMFMTLMMAFGDFVTDFLFAFVELGLKPWIRVTAIALFIIQILLQIFSLQSVIMTVRTQLQRAQRQHQLRYFISFLYPYIGGCGTVAVYPLCWLVYYVAISVISLTLGLTKLIAVRQMQQWWLSLIVRNYKDIADEKLKQYSQNQKNIKQRLQKIGYNMNDIHAVYWAQLDLMYNDEEDEEDEEEEEEEQQVKEEEEEGHMNDETGVNLEHKQENDDDEYDDNYDARFDDDNISMRIQKMNQKKHNIRRAKTKTNRIKNKKRKKKRKKKKRKKKKSKSVDKIWLGWNTERDLGIIFKMYLFVDQYTPKWMRQLYINANVYNTYFLTELIVESLPQCILIITNAYLKNDWTPISITSISFSGLMVIYNVTKIVYYVGYMGMDMRSVVL